MKVRWNEVKGVTGYILYGSKKKKSGYVKMKKIVNGKKAFYEFPFGKRNKGVCYYKVVAFRRIYYGFKDGNYKTDYKVGYSRDSNIYSLK